MLVGTEITKSIELSTTSELFYFSILVKLISSDNGSRWRSWRASVDLVDLDWDLVDLDLDLVDLDLDLVDLDLAWLISLSQAKVETNGKGLRPTTDLQRLTRQTDRLRFRFSMLTKTDLDLDLVCWKLH